MAGLLATKDPTFDDRGQRIPHKGSKVRRVIPAPEGSLAADLARGRTDIKFFALRFLGIKLHPGQARFAIAATMLLGYGPAYLDVLLASGNRAGKTLALAIVIFHHTFYKFGTKPPTPGDPVDLQRWIASPYNWYHIGFEGKVANLVHKDLTLILNGSHPAQTDPAGSRGCPLVKELGAIVEWDRKELGEYPWVRIHQAFGGGEIHFRHTNEKAKALLGLDMNGISFDEAAFELYLVDIRSEVLHLRRLATGGPIYWVSTGTEGYNAFADLWNEGDPENPYRQVRTLSLRMSTRDNIGYGITQEAFDSLIATLDPRLIPQNIDGHFIEAMDAYFYSPSVEAMFDRDIPTEAAPIGNHRYVQGVDPGISSDATASVTLDYTQRPFTGVRHAKRAGRQSLPSVVNMVREGHLLYSQPAPVVEDGPLAGTYCTTNIDSTGMGGKMFKQEFSIIRPLREYDFAGTKSKKLELLSDLKSAIDRGDIKLPWWPTLRRQLLGYKLDDKKIDTDELMALALAVKYALRNPSNPVENPTFSYFG